MISLEASLSYTALSLISFHATVPQSAFSRGILVVLDAEPRHVELVSSLERSGDIPSAFWELKVVAGIKGFATNMNLVLSEALANKADAWLLNNDLYFSAGWYESLAILDSCISSPITNRERGYDVGGWKTAFVMSLEDLNGNELVFRLIAEEHARRYKGALQVLALPFACVKITYDVICGVGLLDEAYGPGGGEDYDYCLRAYLKGFSVAYAPGSYILHFGGKSSYDGVEASSQQHARESFFKNYFRERWGDILADVVMEEKFEALQNDPELMMLINEGKHVEVIRRCIIDRKIMVDGKPIV